MKEKKLYPIEVRVIIDPEDENGIFFDLDFHFLVTDWGDGKKGSIMFRLGKVLSSIKISFPVEVILGGVKKQNLRVTIRAIGGCVLPKKEEIHIDLFDSSQNCFFKASGSEIAVEFLFHLKNACRGNHLYFFSKKELLILRTKEYFKKAKAFKTMMEKMEEIPYLSL